MSRYKSLVALSFSAVLSTAGTRLSAIAIPWLVLVQTESPVLTGLVGLAELLPYVIAKALAGPLIDRYGARRISMLADVASALALTIVPLLYWSGMLSIWMLLPVVAVVGVLRAPADASKQALVPTIVAKDGLPIERVTGVLGAADRLAGTIGAAAAGLLIAALGPPVALIVNALAFVLSGIVVLLTIPRDAVVERKPESNYRADMAEGWKMLSGDPVLRAIVLMIAVTNIFDQAYSVLLLPVWVRTHGLDVSWVGYLLATFSASAILGAVVAAAIGHRLWRLPIYVMGFLCAGPVAMYPYAMGLPVEAIMAILLCGGFVTGFLNPIIGAIMFERIPKPLVGRVIALIGALGMALMPFGGIYGGLLVDGAGIAVAMWVTGTLYMIAAMAPLAVSAFRQMSAKRGQPEGASSLMEAN